MEGIRVTVDGKKLLFAGTGEIVDVSGSGEQIKGKWTAESKEKDNRVRYSIDGVEQPPLPAVYKLTKRNQLQVSLGGDATASKAFTFPGRIEIDSNHEFTYFIIDSTGKDTSAFFALYGSISFAENTVNLVISLTGGGEATITGASGIQSLETAKNHSAAFDADDLLTFRAKTVNVIEGVSEPITKAAIIDFVGTWDVEDGTLVFLSEVKSAPDGNTVNLGFGGKWKAVTAGFVYFADSKGTKTVLNLRGRHVFKGGKGNLTWQTSIGFSETSFDAEVSVKSFVPLSSGQGLTIDGGLTLKSAKNETLTFDLSLQARYEFQNGVLIFKADVSNGIQPSYDLMLAGDLHYSNLHLNFQINYSNSANAKKLAVTVGVQGSRESMIKNVALMLDISESEAKLKLDLTLEARIVLKNGVRVKELAPAPGGDGGERT